MYLLLRPCRAPRTTGPARIAGLGALLTAVGVDDEEEAEFSHPLGSTAAAPTPSLNLNPTLQQQRL